MELDDIGEIEELATRAARKAKKRLQEKVEAPSKRGPKRLTPRQENFCQLCIKYADDVKRAYGEAGFSTAGKFWEQQASRVRNHPKIKMRIGELRVNVAGQADIDEQWLLKMARQFTERAYTLGDIRAGKDVLELIAKLLGALKDREKNAPTALLQTFNFLGNDPKADMARLAKAANVEVIDVEPVEVTLPPQDSPPVPIELSTSTSTEGN